MCRCKHKTNQLEKKCYKLKIFIKDHTLNPEKGTTLIKIIFQI